MAIHRRVLPVLKYVLSPLMLRKSTVVAPCESRMSVSRLRTRSVNMHSRILDEHTLMLILAVWSSETMTRREVRIRTAALLPSLASSHYCASSWTRCVHVEVAGLAYFSAGCQGSSASTECSISYCVCRGWTRWVPHISQTDHRAEGRGACGAATSSGRKARVSATTQPRHRPVTGARL